MSTAGSTLMGCPDVQAELTDFFINCDPALIGFRSPFNEFLWSPLNRRGIQQILNPAPGKKKTVQLRYDQAIPLGQVTAGTIADIDCVATTERGDLTSTYTLPETIQFIEERMSVGIFEDACRTNPEIIMRKIALMMKALREKTYKVTADQFVSEALWGRWGQEVNRSYTPDIVNPAEELEVKTHKDNSIDPFPWSMEIIDNALMMTQYCDRAFITGGNALYEYYRLIRAGCCATMGINLLDILNLYGMVVTWDKYLQAASALNSANLSVAIMPGALQIIYYNPYDALPQMDAAAGVRVGRNYDHLSIVDPVSGMPMNMMVSDNCGTISIQLWTQTKIIAMPEDMFAVGDDNEGVTFVNKIKVVNFG